MAKWIPWMDNVGHRSAQGVTCSARKKNVFAMTKLLFHHLNSHHTYCSTVFSVSICRYAQS